MKIRFFKKPHLVTWSSMGMFACLLLLFGSVSNGQLYITGYETALSLKPGQLEISAESMREKPLSG